MNLKRTRCYVEFFNTVRPARVLEVVALPEIALLMPCPMDRDVMRQTILDIAAVNKSAQFLRERGSWIEGRGHRTDRDARNIRRPPPASVRFVAPRPNVVRAI